RKIRCNSSLMKSSAQTQNAGPVEDERRSGISRGYETTDVRVKPVLWAVILLILGTVILHLALTGLFTAFKHGGSQMDRDLIRTVTPDIAKSRVTFPGPQLQTAPRDDLTSFRARE